MSEQAAADSIPNLDWRGAEYEADPLGVLRDIATIGDIAKTELGYAILGRDLGRMVAREDLPISVGHIPPAISPYLAERTKTPLLTRHGPEHVQLRSILTRALRAQMIETLRPAIRATFDGLLDKVIVAGGGDLVRDLFNPYPALVLAPLLGIPHADIDMVADWVTTSAGWTNILNPVERLPRIEAAWRSLEAYMLALLVERRANLGGDIFSELIRQMAGADDLEVVGIAMEMTRAGLDTTRRQLASTMHALLENPAEWQRLADDPSLASTVVEEGMRYASITHTVTRQAIAEKEIAGVAAEPGTVFTVMAAIANRDPSVYDAPDRFDAARSPCPHMTFGFGSHVCVGAPLARMEMVEAFTALAERVQSVTLCGEVLRSPVSLGRVPTTLRVVLIGRDASA
jgi:cytochrome P450